MSQTFDKPNQDLFNNNNQNVVPQTQAAGSQTQTNTSNDVITSAGIVAEPSAVQASGIDNVKNGYG